MAQITWDDTGKHLYETGVDRGVLYVPDTSGAYSNGVSWNGITAVTETPSGAAATALYANNAKYLNLVSAEDFGATLEAYTYPDEFQAFDGLGVPSAGIMIGQQSRKVFGLSYRTKTGNDISGDSYGYKLHLVYGAQAAPSQKAYKTVNDKPEAITFNWTLTTTPVAVTSYKNTALITIDSTKLVVPANITTLEGILYGAGTAPRLPLPDEIISILSSGAVTIQSITPPSYVNSTHIMTIPTVTGVDFYITKLSSTDGSVLTARAKATAGPQTALAASQEWDIVAMAKSGYAFGAAAQTDWQIQYASADRAAS